MAADVSNPKQASSTASGPDRKGEMGAEAI